MITQKNLHNSLLKSKGFAIIKDGELKQSYHMQGAESILFLNLLYLLYFQISF